MKRLSRRGYPARNTDEKIKEQKKISGKTMISQTLYRARVPILILVFAGLWKINMLHPYPVIFLLLNKLGLASTSAIRLSYTLLMGFYIAGLWLRISGSSILGSETVWGGMPRARALETRGIYGSIRHPIHLGSMLILLSLAPMNSPVSAGIILFFAIPFIFFLANHEDQFLLKHFPEFEKYRKNVPGFIPNSHPLRTFLHPFDENEGANLSSGIRSEFLNISFLGGFSGFILKGNTQAFWEGFASGIILTTFMYFLFKRRLSVRNH
jgi:protein-S-isoprenylcysteine O-methyltransferase Ste14